MDTISIQIELNLLGYGPLEVDGKNGAKTKAAVKKFQQDNGLEVDGKVGPKTTAKLFPYKLGKVFKTQEIIDRYGQPGPLNLVIMDLPFPMIIDWDRRSFTRKIQVHKDIAPNLKAALQEILDYYGIEEIKRLEINIYGGCYNYRKMRGGSDWSRHAWGIAIDLNPSKNTLKASHKTAQFAKPEYAPMIHIFYKHGFVGLGPEEDRDWMHFQIGV